MAKQVAILTHKVCGTCNIDKDISQYTFNILAKNNYQKDCKICKAEISRKYYKNNKEKVLKRLRLYEKDKYKTDPIFKLKYLLRRRVYNIFRQKNFLQNENFKEYIGCTVEQLAKHLELQFKDGMSWDNQGKWHIDHIIPLHSGKTEEEIYKLCHYTNLQPLWASENMSKSGRF